ncbi:MAG: AraC family ligand binding domain-containing protein [Herpetosiphonaceae bacterium]|nr:AraC family ligand binding domain-containing protein [Herpetosiphonaceae bacterium]
MLSGTASFQLGEQIVTLMAQQGIEVPPEIVHQIRNSSSDPIEFLVISQPPTQGDRVTADDKGEDVFQP